MRKIAIAAGILAAALILMNCEPYSSLGGLTYTLTFQPGNGEASWTQKATAREIITLPESPSLEGGGFSGWYAENAHSLRAPGYNYVVWRNETFTGQWNNAAAVTFLSAEANSSETETTTELTLTFDRAVEGLAAEDITLTHSSPEQTITKGTLSGEGPVYILPIEGFSGSGTVNVAVEKEGYLISPKSQEIGRYTTTHEIWFFYPEDDPRQNGNGEYIYRRMLCLDKVTGVKAGSVYILPEAPGDVAPGSIPSHWREETGKTYDFGAEYTVPTGLLEGYQIEFSLVVTQ